MNVIFQGTIHSYAQGQIQALSIGRDRHVRAEPPSIALVRALEGVSMAGMARLFLFNHEQVLGSSTPYSNRYGYRRCNIQRRLDAS